MLDADGILLEFSDGVGVYLLYVSFFFFKLILLVAYRV